MKSMADIVIEYSLQEFEMSSVLADLCGETSGDR